MYYTFFYNPPPLPAAFIFLYYSKFDFIKAAKNKKCLANFLEFKLDLLILNLGGADGHTIWQALVHIRPVQFKHLDLK